MTKIDSLARALGSESKCTGLCLTLAGEFGLVIAGMSLCYVSAVIFHVTVTVCLTVPEDSRNINRHADLEWS